MSEVVGFVCNHCSDNSCPNCQAKMAMYPHLIRGFLVLQEIPMAYDVLDSIQAPAPEKEKTKKPRIY